MADVIYYIDSVNFTTYGVRVSKSKGLFSRPKPKSIQSQSWPEQHGKVVDLAHKYYDSREIKLSCFITGSSKTDFINKATAFLALFDASGTRRLMVDAGAARALFYEVYLESQIDIDKTWFEGQMTGTFELSLIEPSPVKRVYRVTGTSASLTITCPKALDIYWGDGSVSRDVYGTSKVASHTYGSSGTYFIIIAGDIAAIISLTTSATEIWNRL